MGFAGVALVAIAVLIAGFAVPQWINHRQAVLQSREGDRFSEGLRMVSAGDSGKPAPEQLRIEPSTSTVKLLTPPRHPQPEPRQIESSKGAVMSQDKVSTRPPSRHPHVPSGRTQRMTPEQARRLTSLKSQRAARISRESAAGQRRLVTTGVSLALVLLFVVLGATSVLPWAWTVLPTVFLVGTLVASRQAGIRNEKDGAAEAKALRDLEEEIRTGHVAEVAVAPVVEAAVEVLEPVVATDVAESETVVEVVSEPIVTRADSGAIAIDTSEIGEVAATGWSVASFPAPSYARKQKVSGRRVHADTDIIAVSAVSAAAKVPGRPLAATRPEEPVTPAEVVAAQEVPTLSFDLDSVLDARRAAQ